MSVSNSASVYFVPAFNGLQVYRQCYVHNLAYFCSALEALRNALYKCSTYLLTYLLLSITSVRCIA